MRYGDTGDKVTALNIFLREQRYPIGATDIFNEDTLNAVMDCQARYGWRTTGAVEEADLERLRQCAAGAAEQTADPEPQTFHVQRSLKLLGFYPGTLDGVYGHKTRAAALHFQKAAGLAEDGAVGDQTRKALTDHLAVVILPAAMRPKLKQADSGDYVRILQGGLRVSGFYQGGESGDFDQATHNAVCRVQSVAGIHEDEAGLVGQKTWEALNWYCQC
ncbi:MAG: peptidoglycan-binding protein [Clostridiales bacterium]|jgi:peptidoglycan hydrolase-like protein with peptidoglycan-binding domain|nr:peptidoglycan-binding protein [Clostridiales bacterium]